MAILNASKAVRELRPTLHDVKVAFRKWIVVGDVGSTMRFGDSQIGQQQGHRFGSHRGAAIGMQRELASSNALFFSAFLDQSFWPVRRFVDRHHPASDVAAEDIQDHVQLPSRRGGNWNGLVFPVSILYVLAIFHGATLQILYQAIPNCKCK